MMEPQSVIQRLQACLLLLLCVCEGLPVAADDTADAAAAFSHTHTTYYETLHLEPTATEQQIRKAFRTLAVKFHPDKNKSVDAEKNFREITEAYKVLSNNNERRLYDSVGHEAFLQRDSSENHEEDEHDSTFSFSFANFFDDDPFMEEVESHWSFPQDVEYQFEHYSFDAFEGLELSINFDDLDDDEEEFYYHF